MRYALVLAFVLGGCVSIGESDRQLNHQNFQAGKALEADESLPVPVRQMGSDVAANSEVLAEVLGTPEAPVAYSPENSAALRKQALEEHRAPPAWLSWVTGLVKNLPYGELAGTILMGGLALWQSIAKRGAVKKLKSCYDAFDTVKEELVNGQYSTAINDILREAHVLNGVYTEVRADLAAFRKSKS